MEEKFYFISNYEYICIFIAFSTIFPVQDLRNTAKTKVKRFDNISGIMMLLKLFKGVPV